MSPPRRFARPAVLDEIPLAAHAWIEASAGTGKTFTLENLIVELIVREPDGRVRAAKPGETGEVAITDLHNLACPMIRYVTGDLAVARAPAPCRCGRVRCTSPVATCACGPGFTAESSSDGSDISPVFFPMS